MSHLGYILALLPLLPLIAGDWSLTYRLLAERVNALIKQVTGFQGGSKLMTAEAACRLSPTPPASVERNTRQLGWL